jgi:SAM-dependent methyltransferase
MEVTAAVPPTSQGARQTFEAFAPVYDDFTARNNHELWLSNFLPKARIHGLSGHRLLDVGCGTGESFLPMLERDWEVTACDISPSMLAHARAKAGNAARLSVADMRELPEFGEFDLVWSLDDAVNYLLSNEELGRALSGMKANLAPGGLLMFDLNTLQAYRTFYAEEERVERGASRLIWRGQGSSETPPGAISEARFEVETEDSDTETHVHRQKHFPEAEVRTLLDAAGLECLAVYGHGFDAVPQQPLEELVHSKAVYISRHA